MVKPQPWTVVQLAELDRLWRRGDTASAIGRVLGKTKNSIIGKAHRMGLTSRPSPIVRQPNRAATVNPSLKQCQWPFGDVGDADFHFCGAPVFEHAPYCPTHLIKSRRKVCAPRTKEPEAA